MNPHSPYRPPHPSKTPTPTQESETTGTSRTHVYLDDETLHRMIESFGPLEYTQFAATLNPHEPYGALTEQDPFGALGWQPEGPPWGAQDTVSRRKGRSPRTESTRSPEHRYLMEQPQEAIEEGNPEAAEAKKESLIEWFDRSVEKELQKRRDSGGPSVSPVDPALAPLKAKHALNLSRGTAERMAETSASRVEIAARLETDFTTELTDAVEKFAKAETMSNYTAALQAAEDAAQRAPPELMEQVAAAEARRIQTQLSAVKETVPGIRPIEVVGYVGITKPVYAKKSSRK